MLVEEVELLPIALMVQEDQAEVALELLLVVQEVQGQLTLVVVEVLVDHLEMPMVALEVQVL
jgi:hypothetical protein